MTTTATRDTTAGRALEEGRVVAIARPVIDVEFPTPCEIASRSSSTSTSTEHTVAAEVAQQISDGRCAASACSRRMGWCGAPCATSAVSSRSATRARPRLQRAGRAARHRQDRGSRRWEIHRSAPPSTSWAQVAHVQTGIEVIDLLEPYVQGGKIRPVRRCGVGRRSSSGDSRAWPSSTAVSQCGRRGGAGGHRHVARDASRRHRQGRTCLQPDGQAAVSACGSGRPPSP
jgi:hypothetical protein